MGKGKKYSVDIEATLVYTKVDQYDRKAISQVGNYILWQVNKKTTVNNFARFPNTKSFQIEHAGQWRPMSANQVDNYAATRLRAPNKRIIVTAQRNLN